MKPGDIVTPAYLSDAIGCYLKNTSKFSSTLLIGTSFRKDQVGFVVAVESNMVMVMTPTHALGWIHRGRLVEL